MSETNNKLEIKNLSKRFGEKILFENLSLTVDGPAVLWAPSGWGKTTLLRILMGLEAPTSGSVEGVGRVGAVFQEDRLCPQLTAEENVALVLTAEQYKVKTQYKEQIRDDLIQLGLDDEALALPARKLSGGQKRRTALLRALWAESDTLLLDEPFTGMDPAVMKKAAAMLKARCGTKPTLLATHDQEAIRELGWKIIELAALRSYRAASRCALSLGRPPPGRLAAGCLFVSSGRRQLFGQGCVCRLHHAGCSDGKRCGSGFHDGRRNAALSARIESRRHERPGRKN